MGTRAKAIAAVVVILVVAALIFALEVLTAGALPWWGLGYGLGFLNDLIGVYRQVVDRLKGPQPAAAPAMPCWIGCWP